MVMLTTALLVGLIGVPTASIQADTVTFERPAMRLDPLLSELRSETGIPVTVSQALANEVVLVSVRELDTTEFLETLGETVSGRWEQTNDGFRLMPDTGVWRSQETASVRRQAEALRAALGEQLQRSNRARAEADPLTESRTAQTAFGFGGARTPEGQALIELAQSLPMETLAAMQPNDRLVFSSPANSMQQRLPARDVNRTISAAIEEFNRRITRVTPQDQRRAQAGGAGGQGAQFFERFLGGGANSRQPITTAPVKTSVAVTRGGAGFGGIGGGDYTFQLFVFNAEGQIILSANLPLGLEAMMAAIEAGEFEGAESGVNSTDQSNSSAIRYSELSQEFQQFTSVGGANFLNRPQPSELLLERLLNPERYDPLSFVMGEALSYMAEDNNASIIAYLPDSVLGVTGATVPRDTGTLASFLLESDEVKVVVDSDLWIISPADPHAARSSRLDRFALGTLVRKVEQSVELRLDDLAAYAVANPAPLESPVSLIYLGYFAPGTIFGGITAGLTDWGLLRLYGNLNNSHRNTLRNGGQVPLSQLSGTARNAVRDYVFGASARVTAYNPNPPQLPGPLAIFSDFGQLFSGFAPARDYTQEVTEVMPNGLPQQGFLTARVTESDVLYPVDDAGRVQRQLGALDANTIAITQTLANQPQLAEFRQFAPQFSRGYVGERLSMSMAIVVGDALAVQGQLNDDRVTGRNPVALNQLPPRFQQALAQRNAIFGQLGNAIGGQIDRQQFGGRQGRGNQAP